MNPKSNIEMKKVLLKILFIFFPIILFAQNNYYDVVVVGGTPGGNYVCYRSIERREKSGGFRTFGTYWRASR